MRKSTRLINRFAALFLVVLMSFEDFAAVVSDNDGAAFITKAEFDSLKNGFLEDLNGKNMSIDDKINGIITAYMSGISLKSEKILPSMLNQFSSDRRKFVNNIKNPTTSTQENLYISTNGFWTANWSRSNQSGSLPDGKTWEDVYWFGWMFAGLNNYDNEPGLGTHHIRKPWEKNNLTAGDGKGNGKYVFIDYVKENDDSVYYIEDEYVKDLKFKIWSVGSDETYPVPMCDPTSIQPYDTAEIKWDNVHYNWTGNNYRTVGTYKLPDGTGPVPMEVQAAETLYLDIANYDYDTNTTALDKIPWVNNIASGAVYTENTGCLINKDQYNWSYYMSDFKLGKQGNQVYGASYRVTTTPVNTYVNGTNRFTTSNQTGLYFYVPKITSIGCNKLGPKDVYDVSGVLSYYHSGLPLVKLSKGGDLKIKLKITRKNNNRGVTVGIRKGQFNNVAISAETGSDLIFRKTYTSADLSSGEVEISIDNSKLKNINDTILWIKAYEESDVNGYVILETEEIKLKG